MYVPRELLPKIDLNRVATFMVDFLLGLIRVEDFGSVVYSPLFSPLPVRLLPDDFRDRLLFNATFSGGI